MRYFRLLLFPFSLIYGLIMGIRNWFYDSGILKSISFNLPVISVGNLTAGGTGKTPMTEYLIRLLKDKYQVAVLSRGYKRQTTGVIIAGNSDNALTIGDEPYQLYKKFHPQIGVNVGEDRVYAVPFILKDQPDTEILILDDAFQHRRIRPSLQILVTEYSRLFYRDFIIPAGFLRESRYGAGRADAVVVTKCPEELPEEARSNIIRQIGKYTGNGNPVFFSSIRYEKPQPFGTDSDKMARNIILVTGIANPGPLSAFLRSKYEIIKHFRFPDHHFFTAHDIKMLIDFYQSSEIKDISILFTEKDYFRLESTALKNKLRDFPVFFQPITYKFVAKGKDFDEMIINSIKDFTISTRK